MSHIEPIWSNPRINLGLALAVVMQLITKVKLGLDTSVDLRDEIKQYTRILAKRWKRFKNGQKNTG